MRTQHINAKATFDERNFTYLTSESLIEQGVPANAVMDVMFGMCDAYEEEGFYVEMEIEYV